MKKLEKFGARHLFPEKVPYENRSVMRKMQSLLFELVFDISHCLLGLLGQIDS